MIFTIRMGQPLVFSLWNSFNDRFSSNSLKPSELIFFKKWTKALQHLQSNPHYPGLHSHEISALSRRTGFPIFESYLENNNSTAYRMYWFYGYGKNEITICGITPRPESQKRGSYDRVSLSLK